MHSFSPNQLEISDTVGIARNRVGVCPRTIVLALRRLEKEDLDFRANQGFIIQESRLACTA